MAALGLGTGAGNPDEAVGLATGEPPYGELGLGTGAATGPVAHPDGDGIGLTRLDVGEATGRLGYGDGEAIGPDLDGDGEATSPLR